MADLSERLKTALADRYRVEREIGRGGMAHVFLAHDLKLDRAVALKVLRPDLAAVLGAERFLHEITIAAQLQHPNILPLHDSGEADRLLFYVMPYVEGESLRDRLNRERQLPIDEALRLAGQVADALDCAHRQGVVHRDIKPENILLREGHALVSDFGIALAVSSAGGTRMTETGLVLGTPAYMSPEQVAGDREIDGRSDIYSLGCVLYEMLAGDPPFLASTPRAVLAKHVTDPVPPITTVRPSIPQGVAVAITMALSKMPVDRYASAKEFSKALHAEPKALQPVLESVAVLPFSNISPDPENEYFSDGITEEIITVLSQVSGLRVASRTSSFYFKGTPTAIKEVGTTLGVATVLEGSVRRVGKRVRITAQLIDVRKDEHLWSGRYDREIDDIFAVQDDIARAVTAALKVTLLGDVPQPLYEQGTCNVDAYDAYLMGRYHWNKRTAADLAQAAVHFEEAIKADPEYTMAWSALADTYLLFHPSQYNVHTLPWEQALQRGDQAAQRALALDDSLAEAWTALSAIRERQKDYPAAESGYRRAISLNPDYSTAHQWLACLLLTTERDEEALRELRRARELDPLSMIIGVDLIVALDALGRHGDASEGMEELSRRYPDALVVNQHGSYHYISIGKFDRAAPYIGRAVASHTDRFGTARRIAERVRDVGTRETALLEVADWLGRPEGAIVILRALRGTAAALDRLEQDVNGPNAESFYLPALVGYLGHDIRQSPRGKAALRKLRGEHLG